MIHFIPTAVKREPKRLYQLINEVKWPKVNENFRKHANFHIVARGYFREGDFDVYVKALDCDFAKMMKDKGFTVMRTPFGAEHTIGLGSRFVQYRPKDAVRVLVAYFYYRNGRLKNEAV